MIEPDFLFTFQVQSGHQVCAKHFNVFNVRGTKAAHDLSRHYHHPKEMQPFFNFFLKYHRSKCLNLHSSQIGTMLLQSHFHRLVHWLETDQSVHGENGFIAIYIVRIVEFFRFIFPPLMWNRVHFDGLTLFYKQPVAKMDSKNKSKIEEYIILII